MDKTIKTLEELRDLHLIMSGMLAGTLAVGVGLYGLYWYFFKRNKNKK